VEIKEGRYGMEANTNSDGVDAVSFGRRKELWKGGSVVEAGH
jgi:hypothetical protein